MPVEAWEDKIVLKTYLRGPDDPLPHWERTGLRRVYPYPMQDDLTDVTSNISYRALHLENEYLHVIVLPELGGRLYSLYDKTSNREVFYRNNVVKPGLIARRGAWISGGIEFNFPQGHTCVTVSAVAGVITRDDATGAASIHVGTIDRVSRMRWAVTLSLSPDEARLRQDVLLENLMPWRQRYYFWANAAVPARDDLHLVYPAKKCRTLGGEYPYPIQNGRDMSWYRNHERPNDIFALDVVDDFFGCYYETADVGLVHWSDHRENVGKKFFTWGTADEGMIWVDLLTDDDGQYVELQSGRFVDQSTFEFLRPYECVRWTEFWYPLHGMGSFCWANSVAALNLDLHDRATRVAALVNVPLGEADLVLDVDGEEVWRSAFVFEPGQPLVEEVEAVLPRGQDVVVGLSLETDDETIIRYEQPPPYLRGDTAEFSLPDDLPGPKEAYDDWRKDVAALDLQALGPTVPAELPKERLRSADDPAVSVEELWRHGVRAEKVDDLARARELYEKALEKDPGFSGAHVGWGVLALRRNDPDEALPHLREAVARNPDCEEAWYYLACAYWQMGGWATAQEIWGRLVGGSACRTEAAISLAKSLSGLSEIFGEMPDSPLGTFLLSRNCRVEGAIPSALLTMLADDHPLAPELAAEEYLVAREIGNRKRSERAWKRLRGLLLDDPNLWLELCFLYQQMGATEDGWTLLLRAAQESPRVRRSPIVRYVLAFASGLGWEIGDDLLEEETDPEFCFPSCAEETGYLEIACRADPGDWEAHLYLGNLYASLGQPEQALEAWQTAAEIDDSNAILCRNLGLAYHLWQHDTEAALGWYAKAIHARPDEYRLYLERDDVFRASGEAPVARLEALELAPPEQRDHWTICARRVECLVELQRWDDALGLLQTHTFRPWEGARQMHGLWTRALCGRAAEKEQAGDYAGALADYELALTYPRNLGVGRSAHPQDAKVRWLAAQCAAKIGDVQKQRDLLQAAADERHERPCEADIYSFRAMQALGREEKAAELANRLRSWAAEQFARDPSDELAKQIREVVG